MVIHLDNQGMLGIVSVPARGDYIPLPLNANLQLMGMRCNCRHIALGSHDLSILLAIKDSKQLHLHLTGVTVPSDHMCMGMMDQPFQLAPVPIGEAHPPRQTYCLRNGGPAELQYSIDTAPLQQLIKSNYGYEVGLWCCLCVHQVQRSRTAGTTTCFWHHMCL